VKKGQNKGKERQSATVQSSLVNSIGTNLLPVFSKMNLRKLFPAINTANKAFTRIFVLMLQMPDVP
jgi:hypothetical protein